MRHFLIIIFSFVLGTASHAGCSGPRLFSQLPALEQNTLRTNSAQTPNARGLLWKVSRNGVSSYLVGTMHVHDPRHEMILNALEPLMDEVDSVYLELTKPDEQAFMKTLTGAPDLYLINSGPSLMERLGADAWEALLPRLKEAGVPAMTAARYRPWFLSLAMSIPPCVKEDQSAGLLGLDRLIEQAALKKGVPLLSLDTTEMLIETLAGDPLEKQVEDFREYLSFGLNDAEAIHDLIWFYFNEEVQLAADFNTYHIISGLPADRHDRVRALVDEAEADLLVDRNSAWMSQLEPALGSGPALVAVGAFHLPGETGLVALLEEAGFTATRIPLPRD